MKNLFYILGFVFSLSYMTSCTNAPEGKKVEATEAQKEKAPVAEAVLYTVNTNASKVNWTGTKPGGQHMGTMNISKGAISVANGEITSGEFVLDFASISNTDLPAGEGKEDLEAHLKSGDFFEAEKFPTGRFVITKVTPVTGQGVVTHDVTGNLTMKDITKSVTIPVSVAMTEGKVSAQSTAFTIDRTLWDITFSSTALNTAKDKLINDQIGLLVTLVAEK